MHNYQRHTPQPGEGATGLAAAETADTFTRTCTLGMSSIETDEPAAAKAEVAGEHVPHPSGWPGS